MNLTFREAILTFKRAPLLSVLSVTTIAFSLFVLGLFGLVVINLQDALRGVEDRVEVVAYLLPGAPIEATAQALKDIEAFPEVQSATYGMDAIGSKHWTGCAGWPRPSVSLWAPRSRLWRSSLSARRSAWRCCSAAAKSRSCDWWVQRTASSGGPSYSRARSRGCSAASSRSVSRLPPICGSIDTSCNPRSSPTSKRRRLSDSARSLVCSGAR